MEQLLKLARQLKDISKSSTFYWEHHNNQGILEKQITTAKEDICQVIGEKLEDIILEEIEKLKEQTQTK